MFSGLNGTPTNTLEELTAFEVWSRKNPVLSQVILLIQ